MKISHVTIVWSALPLMLLTSCAPDWGWDSPGNFYVQAGWTSARYDSAGFPIYGYYNNRPVYGYTSAGLPVFNFIELNRTCIVPNWKPAPHYHGNWQYPPHIDRRPTPPTPPRNHQTHERPDQPKHTNNFQPGFHGGPQPSHSPIGIKKQPNHIQNSNNSKLPHRQENITRPNVGNHSRIGGKDRHQATGLRKSNGGNPSASPSHVFRKRSAPPKAKSIPHSPQAQRHRSAIMAPNGNHLKKP